MRTGIKTLIPWYSRRIGSRYYQTQIWWLGAPDWPGASWCHWAQTIWLRWRGWKLHRLELRGGSNSWWRWWGCCWDYGGSGKLLRRRGIEGQWGVGRRWELGSRLWSLGTVVELGLGIIRVGFPSKKSLLVGSMATGSGFAWGGFARFNLLEIGFPEFEIFLFGLIFGTMLLCSQYIYYVVSWWSFFRSLGLHNLIILVILLLKMILQYSIRNFLN